MYPLTMRDQHTHPHKWEGRSRSGWKDLFEFFVTLLIIAGLLLSVYYALFHG